MYFTITSRIVILIGVIIFFGIIIKLIQKNSLDLKYTLLWFASGIIILIIDAFPQLFEVVMSLLGIRTYMYGVIMLGMAFLTMILMAITSIVSKQKQRIKTLIQQNALLEKRIRDLEQGASESR
ncbi:DUF2304 domain-containing protein [Butyrivibrio fibrisolvens]|uniref:DUF2304 domain-containing protein n=1 Tax=Butyrivibrio fibrisolvens TaxID=831 RepID=UPI0020BE3925|nr:DUF2304 domain-containing protein [Butyrivibrio fibrisolvens]